MFDRIARRYDLLNHLLSGGLDVYWRARAIRELGLTGRERVLDVCAGTADVMIAALRAAGRGARYAVGVDFAHQMLRIGRPEAGGVGACPLGRRSCVATRCGLPVASGSVDAATIAFGIRNVFAPGDALADIARCLRPERPARRARVRDADGAAHAIALCLVFPAGAAADRRARVHATTRPTATCRSRSARSTRPSEFRQLLTDSGFADVRAVPLTFGIVYLYVARKATVAASDARTRRRPHVGAGPAAPAGPL